MTSQEKLVKRLKILTDEITYGGHLAAFSAASLTVIAAKLANLTFDWWLFVIVYLFTQPVYLFNRYKEREIDAISSLERASYADKSLRRVPVSMVIYFVLFFLISIQMGQFKVLILGIVLVCFGVLYTLSLKGWTRIVPGFKNICVSLIWASLVLIAVLYYKIAIGPAALIAGFFIFFKALANTIISDVKDTDGDKKIGLKTIPIFFGEKKGVWIAVAFSLLSFACIAVGFLFGLIPPVSLLLVTSPIYTWLYAKTVLKKDSKKKEKYIYGIIIDGEGILYLILFLMFEAFI